MGVGERIANLSEELDSKDCTLIAVSKTKPPELILEAYSAGHRDFGENKVQDLVSKYETLPKDIRWHMIGHLQRNKVKYIAPFVHLIHGIDSEKLLIEINKQAERNGRTISCLLQIHIAEEESKFGFNQSEVMELLNSDRLQNYTHVKIKGLMGMATFTRNDDQIHREFHALKEFYNSLKANQLVPNLQLDVLSMGMSGDYKIALDEGSNMVRIGTAIFGERNYPNSKRHPV